MAAKVLIFFDIQNHVANNCQIIGEELGGDAGAGGEDADAVVVAVAFDGGSGLLGDEFAGACFSSSGYKGSTKF